MAVDLADVARRFGPEYLERHGARMPPSHARAIHDIADCRTEAMGGQLWHCPDCGQDVYVYHGCRNRHCPACHADQTRKWLEARQAELLPCGYFHVTVTVPEEMRPVMRKNQKDGYGLLMRIAAEAVMTLCRDPKHLGATPAILSVLHTWTRTMDYHPHVHMLTSAGGVSEDGRNWLDAKPGFLVPVKALSRLVRRRMREELAARHPDILDAVPKEVWRKEWVANILPWGGGKTGVLEYLARYVFRIAISNSRLTDMDDSTVVFKYKDRKKKRWRSCRLSGEEFLRRFLQHCLPPGFHKVRYYGLWHPAKRPLAARARLLPTPDIEPPTQTGTDAVSNMNSGFCRCPYCGGQKLEWRRDIPRPRSRSP